MPDVHATARKDGLSHVPGKRALRYVSDVPGKEADYVP